MNPRSLVTLGALAGLSALAAPHLCAARADVVESTHLRPVNLDETDLSGVGYGGEVGARPRDPRYFPEVIDHH